MQKGHAKSNQGIVIIIIIIFIPVLLAYKDVQIPNAETNYKNGSHLIDKKFRKLAE